ncbi:MAG: nucleotidyltransferase domain-containing protein [Anaerolineae bacterium]
MSGYNPSLREKLSGGYAARFVPLLEALLEACRRHYGENLVSLVVFGSLGRGRPRPTSDVDQGGIFRTHTPGRLSRADDFAAHVEPQVEPYLRDLAAQGVFTAISPVLKTTDEVEQGSPLFLDMTEDALILYDREEFFATWLSEFRVRLARQGARRIWRGDRWYWDLKPGYRPGEVFEI